MKITSKAKLFEALLIVVTIIWGTGFPITEIALKNGFTTFMLMSSRFIIGSIILIIFFHKHLRLCTKNHLIAGFITGMCLFLGFYFQTKGLEFTTSSKNAFLTQVCVIFTPFISWMIFRKHPPAKAFIASFTSIVGILILTNVYHGIETVNFGDFLTLIAALTIAFHVVFTAYFIEKFALDAIVFTIIQFIFVAILSVLLTFMLEKEVLLNIDEYLDFSKNKVLLFFPLFYLGFLNTAFGFTVQTFAIKYTSPTRTSIIVSQEALVGTVASIIIVGERISINIIVGGIMIILALLMSETNLLHKMRRFLRI